MRLAIVASHPIQYHAPLFRELARRVDLTVFYTHRATPTDQAQAGFGVGFDWDVDLLSGYEHVFLQNVARRPGLHRFAGCDTPEVGERLREGAFSAVLVLGWQRKALLQAIVAAKLLGLTVLARGDSQLLTPRSTCKRAAKAVVYPPLLRLFDAALYVGQRSRAYWERYRYPASRLFFSPHCVDNEWFAARATAAARANARREFALAPTTRAILFAGKLIALKRPLDVIAAAARLRARGREVAVLVAGAGPLEPDMRAAAHADAVPLYVLGFRNQSEMPAVYAASDVLVLASDSETWGLVANEALACGRPIVLSEAVGAAPDLVGDGRAGRSFAVGDTDALAEALDQMIEAPPNPAAIAAKSAAYSVAAAASGVEIALSECAR